MGAYADTSDRLIERGFAAIPIIPGTKKPGILCDGQWLGLANWPRRYNRGVPAEAIRRRWAAGDSGLAVLTGAASKGTIGIDIDTDDKAIDAAIRSVLPPTPVKKRGAKGETLFYYGPKITASRKWTIDDKTVVELLGPGRQTVLPPTVHPDTGQPYAWTGTETLEDIEPHQLPELGADIADRITAALVPFGYEAEAEPAHSNGHGDGGAGDDDSPHRQLNDAALADLAAWVPALGLYRCRPARGGYEAVPTWRPSTTGREPEKRQCNLKLASAGIRDFGDDQGYTPLDLVMAARGCDLEEAWAFLSGRLGFGDGPAIELPPPEPAPARESEKAPGAPQPGGALPAEAKDSPTGTAGPAIDHLEPLTDCPGVVGDIVDWIVGTARRPNRTLALGVAVTVVGTLVGRRVAGPTRSATHLYVVNVAETGAGKQHLLDSAAVLLTSVKAHGHLGPSEFISMPAVINFLLRKPLSLCVQDEFGAFLKRAVHPKASGWEQALSKILRTLWGTSFAPMNTPEWANREMVTVQSPALSILGFSTSREFTAAMQGEVDNGLLNRFLVLRTEKCANDRDPELTPGEVPNGISAALRELYLWGDPLSVSRIDDPEVAHVPNVLPWASEQARERWRDLERRHDAHDPDLRPYIARINEQAVRLATIRACGRWGPGAGIDLSDLEWGADIAWTSGLATANAAIGYMPTNERSMWGEKILALIERRGTAKVRDIQMHIRGALRSTEIKDLLRQYNEAGLIEWTVDGYRRQLSETQNAG